MDFDLATTLQQGADLLRHLANPPWLYVALGTLGLLLFLWLLVRRQPRSIVAFSDKSGRVRVSLQAIADMAKATCEQVEAVRRVKVRVKAVRGRPVIELVLRLDNTGNIRVIRNGLKRHIGLVLEDNLGFEKGGDIHIEIEGIKGGPLSVPGAPPLALTADEQEDEARREAEEDPLLPEAEDRRSTAKPVHGEPDESHEPPETPETPESADKDPDQPEDPKEDTADRTPDPMARPGSWFARRRKPESPDPPETEDAGGERPPEDERK